MTAPQRAVPRGRAGVPAHGATRLGASTRSDRAAALRAASARVATLPPSLNSARRAARLARAEAQEAVRQARSVGER